MRPRMWKSNGGISGLVFIFKKWEKVFPLFLTCFHLLQKDREGGREAGKRERERESTRARDQFSIC